MGKKRTAQKVLVTALCLGIASCVVALSVKGISPSTNPARLQEQQNPNSGGLGHKVNPESWSTVDDFRKGLPTLLSNSGKSPGAFNIEALARLLFKVRVGGLPVCSPDEVSAEQYIHLSEIAHKLEGFENATTQLNSLLNKPSGITDCQFRVLDGATTLPGVTKI